MAEYYTKPEADALFSPIDHNHNIESLGGTELPANRVSVPESVSESFDSAFTMDEALSSIATQLSGKAPTSHTHSNYSPTNHTHSDYASTSHTHTPDSIGASPSNHTHTPASIGAATASHTHTPDDIGAAPASHSHDYAASTHTHTQSEISGLEAALTVKADASALTGKADLVDGKVPASQLPSFVDDVEEYTAVANFPTTGEDGKIYVATGTNKSYRWSGSTYVELSQSVALGETSSTAYRGDRGKTAYDHSQNSTVHVTAAQKTAWDGKAACDHTHTPAAIGAAAASHTHNYAASSHTHSYNDLSDKPTIPAAYSHPASHPASMITGLSDVATSGSYDDLTDKPTIPSAYTHPSSHPASMITGLATVATTGKYSDLTGKPTIPTIPASLPANGGNADTVDNKHASDFATADHTHDYFPTSGGTINGDTNVVGTLRVKSQQAFHYSESANAQTIGTNNATGGTTIACGSDATCNINGATVKTGNVVARASNTYNLGNTTNRWKGIYSNTAVNVASDERLKRDIAPMDAAALATFIEKLNVVSYNYREDAEDAKARIGLIAQDVQRKDAELSKFFVTEDENGMLGMTPADLVFPLIAAVQALSRRVSELENK